MEIQTLIKKAVDKNASDLHILANHLPIYRVNGLLSADTSESIISPDMVEQMLLSMLSASQKELLSSNRAIDFSYKFGDQARLRVNMYYQQGTLAAAFRLLPAKIKTITELKLPKICNWYAGLKQGFIIVTGPTGHGKTTTIASIINEINHSRSSHVITIEDPIEYVYEKGKSIISQREINYDTHSWQEALRNALREDPDVVVIGEMRDPESMASAITIAETGHLVFSTLHTNSASQSIDRIIDSFPESQQNQVRVQLAATLVGVMSQRLIPSIDGKRIVATEVIVGNNAVRTNIRDGKTYLLDSIIETSYEDGMYSLEASLAQLVKGGKITAEAAQRYVMRPESFARLIK